MAKKCAVLRERTANESAFYSLFLLFSMFLRSFLKNNCAKFAFYAIRKGGKNVEFGTTFCINSTAFCMNTNGYLLQNTMQSPTKRNANSYKTQYKCSILRLTCFVVRVQSGIALRFLWLKMLRKAHFCLLKFVLQSAKN